MSDTHSQSFVHRHNRDGSFDAICALCAATAASASVESELRDGELKHICDRYLLEARLKYITQSAGASKPPEAAS